MTTVALPRIARMHVTMNKLGLHVMNDLGPVRPNTLTPRFISSTDLLNKKFTSMELVCSNEEATSDDRSKKLEL